MVQQKPAEGVATYFGAGWVRCPVCATHVDVNMHSRRRGSKHWPVLMAHLRDTHEIVRREDAGKVAPDMRAEVERRLP